MGSLLKPFECPPLMKPPLQAEHPMTWTNNRIARAVLFGLEGLKPRAIHHFWSPNSPCALRGHRSPPPRFHYLLPPRVASASSEGRSSAHKTSWGMSTREVSLWPTELYLGKGRLGWFFGAARSVIGPVAGACSAIRDDSSGVSEHLDAGHWHTSRPPCVLRSLRPGQLGRLPHRGPEEGNRLPTGTSESQCQSLRRISVCGRPLTRFS